MIRFEVNLFIFTDCWLDPPAKLEASFTYFLGQRFLLYDSNHYTFLNVVCLLIIYLSASGIMRSWIIMCKAWLRLVSAGDVIFPDAVLRLFFMISTFLFLSMYQILLIFCWYLAHAHIILDDCIKALLIAKVLIFSSLQPSARLF